MARTRRRSAPLVLSACGLAIATTCATTCSPLRASEEPAHPASLDEAIIRSAARHGVPESLVRRVVMRESKYNPHARNHSFWGLMQISYPTAKSMGFRGSPQELLNPVVNLRYAVPYLANAFVIAGKRQDAAIRLYAHGYYEAAKHRGLLSALRTAESTPLSGVPDEPDLVAVAAPPPPEDTGIFGALFGPQQMQRDPQTEQVVYASAAPDQGATPVPQSATVAPAPAPDGKSGDSAERPSRSALRDGGTTVIARGEQGIEQVAAYSRSADASDAHARGRHRSHKSTVFASLDAPPAGAQAYAAVAGGGDPRLMQSESQAAIAQATAAQPVAAQAPGDPASSASPPPAAAAEPAAPSPQTAGDDTSTKKGHRRHLARRGRHQHEELPTPAVASAQPQDSQPLPARAADAGAAQGQQPAPSETAQAPQPAPVDASGQPVAATEGAAPQSQPQQQAAADDPAEASSVRKHKHRSRHAHARKSTDVAAQAAGDGEPQPAEYQPK